MTWVIEPVGLMADYGQGAMHAGNRSGVVRVSKERDLNERDASGLLASTFPAASVYSAEMSLAGND